MSARLARPAGAVCGMGASGSDAPIGAGHSRDAGAWERLGRLRLRLMDREGALGALRRALALGAGEEVHDLVVQALAIEPHAAEAAH